MALEHPVILTSESDIARAWMATPSVVAEITGREDIPLEAYKQEPQGDRITVLRDRHPTTWGGVLHIPESAKELTIISVGLIIGVGPEAGTQTPYPAGPICHPSQLIYRHISYGVHTGVALRFSAQDTKYDAAVLIMTVRDIWAIDWDDNPYEWEREEMAKFEALHTERLAKAAQRVREEVAAEERLKAERLQRAHSLVR